MQFEGGELEEIKGYKYLETILSNTGNFRNNEINLKKKELRASYYLLKNIALNLKSSSAIKLFDKVIEPILLCNSEVTNAFFHKLGIMKNLKNQGDLSKSSAN